ncbi:MAG: hypothetical protein OH335_04070 [Candidatus Parvarchaeota archaeon]|nr:hypothetical protein [Candidatus Jingweiarchaeum tengchongense]
MILRVVHIIPLIYGEFNEDLILKVREKVDLLSLDVQGFLRRIELDGELKYYDCPEKEVVLPIVDILKTNQKEAFTITNIMILKSLY